MHDRYSTRIMTSNTFEVLSALIPKRKTKVIGFSEIKWMDLRITGPIIAASIAIQAEEHFLSKDTEDLCAKIRSTPVHNLPWYNLIKTLFLADRLHDFLRWQYRLPGLRAPPGSITQDNTTAFCGIVSITLLAEGIQYPPLVILSYYDRVTIEQHVKKLVFMMKWRDLKESFL